MKTKETKLATLRELRDFLNGLPERNLNKPIHVLIGENETAHHIQAVEAFTEDHINPSGECLEPISDYRPGGQFYEDLETRIEDLDREAIAKSEGDIYFTAPEND